MNTCYTCFDGDTDIRYYRLMQAWHENDRFQFTFINAHDIAQARDTSTEETIKRSLRLRLNSSDIFLVLVGQSTKHLYKFVRWEIEVAIEKCIPLVVVNIDGNRSVNYELCPPILRQELAIHIPFQHRIIDYTIKHWAQSFKQHLSRGNGGPYYYPQSVYDELGI